MITYGHCERLQIEGQEGGESQNPYTTFEVIAEVNDGVPHVWVWLEGYEEGEAKKFVGIPTTIVLDGGTVFRGKGIGRTTNHCATRIGFEVTEFEAGFVSTWVKMRKTVQNALKESVKVG